MEIDESGWHDLNERLERLQMTPAERDILVSHLMDRLVGHFGVDSFEAHLGKNDPRRHAMHEVAAAAIAHLGPVLDELPASAMRELLESQRIGTPHLPPWDDHWRTQSRTASWRS